jgi:hypothetical protein
MGPAGGAALKAAKRKHKLFQKATNPYLLVFSILRAKKKFIRFLSLYRIAFNKNIIFYSSKKNGNFGLLFSKLNACRNKKSVFKLQNYT